jgi:hypothetical protein
LENLKMDTYIKAAVVAAVILVLAQFAARAESCLGDPRCISTQNDWATATEADKRSSAYGYVREFENQANSPTYWRQKDPVAGAPPKATTQTGTTK